MDPKDKSVFTEDQRFSQWWLWLLLILVDGVVVFAMIQQLVFDKPFDTAPMSNKALITIFIGMVLLSAMLLSFRLKTRIDREGIHVKFFPFYGTEQHFSWDKIKAAYVRKYNPILEYGGWGWRYGLFGKGKAYNLSGKVGLQVEFKSGKRLLIGTRKGEELAKFLDEHGFTE